MSPALERVSEKGISFKAFLGFGIYVLCCAKPFYRTQDTPETQMSHVNLRLVLKPILPKPYCEFSMKWLNLIGHV
jgi:hypothetical protein